MSQLTPKARADLIRLLREKLITGELRDIALDFGLRASNNNNLWGKLGGENDNDRVLNLVDYARSVERIAELYEAIEEWRPDLKDRLPTLQFAPLISTGSHSPTLALPVVITAQNETKAQEFYERGVKYNADGDYDLAINVFTLAVDLKPDFKEVYRYRAESYYNTGEYDKAIADCDKALSFDPNYARVYNGRGASYARKNDDDKAITDYNKAIALDPNFGNAYNNRGVIYRKKGEYDKAITDYNKAIALDPNFAWSHYNRGLAYKANRNKTAAQRDFQRAADLGNEPAKEELRKIKANEKGEPL